MVPISKTYMPTFSSPAKDYMFLYQFILYYSKPEFLRVKVQPMTSAWAAIGAVVIECGISKEDFGAIIRLCETKIILVVGHFGDIPVLPAMAPNEEGPLPSPHLQRPENQSVWRAFILTTDGKTEQGLQGERDRQAHRQIKKGSSTDDPSTPLLVHKIN